jgi:diadenylate cyclase
MSVALNADIDEILQRAVWCPRDVLLSTLALAEDIAREGHEGVCVGALFTIGQADRVLPLSRPLILDPLQGHVPAATHITDPQLRGTAKQLARLDGAFVIANDGTVRAACRYLAAPADSVKIPLGLGSRHFAAAAMSKYLGIIAVVVSQSGMVRVFSEGELMVERRLRRP